MATVVSMPRNNTPVTMQEAFYALSVCRDAIAAAMPEQGGVSIKLEPSGAMRVEIVVGGLPSEAVQNQQRIVFKIENNMIPGYTLAKPTVGFEHGKTAGKRAVFCLLDPAFRQE